MSSIQRGGGLRYEKIRGRYTKSLRCLLLIANEDQRSIGEEKLENFQDQIKNHQERIKQFGYLSEAEMRVRKTYV
ncbi:MAG: hypothetical protein ACMUEM_02475 [Flavobacteriales bacterium AspAUS03]